MAEPTIVFNSSTGSDTAASGAGPSSALTGTGASLSASTSIDLSADSPDLSGVSTDGSACLWVQTSSGRQFFKIESVNNTSKVVTVGTAAGVTESSRTWAIGGKRATWDNTNSRTLFSSDGLKDGWVAETETDQSLTSAIALSADADAVIKGSTGAEIVTQTANEAIFTYTGDKISLQTMVWKNSNGTKTTAYGIGFVSNGVLSCRQIVADDASEKLKHFEVRVGGTPTLFVERCKIGNTTDHGVNNYPGHTYVFLSEIHDCGASGIRAGSNRECQVYDSILRDNGSHGVDATSQWSIQGCVFVNNTGSGVNAAALTKSSCRKNIFVSNGAYGVNSNSSAQWVVFDRNAYYGNTSGEVNGVDNGPDDITLSADPFVDSGSDDYNLNDTSGGGADLRSATVTVP